MMEGGKRVRLLFEHIHILNKSQRLDGLTQSWLLLKPHLHTISHLSSHLLHTFHLHQSCPHGLLLSMDGFVLPPFESTCILNDKDVICVKKKSTLLDIVKVDDVIEEGEVVEKQPVHTGVLLLANEEFEKETGGYESENEEDEEEEDQREDALNVEASTGVNTVSKKRKASEKLKSPKKKKQCRVVAEDAEDDHTEQIETDGTLHKKNLQKKEKVSNDKSTSKMASTSKSAERSNDNVELTPSVKKSELQENGEGIEDASHVPEETKKLPSRSARRKKAKRRWLREMAKIGKKAGDHSKLDWKQKPAKAEKELNWKQKTTKTENKELHWKQKPAKAEKKEIVGHSKGLLHLKQAPEKDLHKTMTENERPNQNSDVEDNVVPIVIRPGHIRFEPLGEDQAVQQNPVSVETFHWNGITSKKKGQNWGREKISSSRKNDYNDLDKEYFEELAIKKVPMNDAINFDNLPYLLSWPKEGDVIAYRLLELSSTWTPELSSFRVGKISNYNSESSKIMLLPVPEYPVFSEKSDEDASVLQQDNPLYKEDGSLETDFSSLVDARIVKEGISYPAKAATGRTNEWPIGNANAITSVVSSNNDKRAQATTSANGGVNPWDQFSEAVNAKNAELSEENGWTRVSSGRSGWSSYRATRGSALGQTMSNLR